MFKDKVNVVLVIFLILGISLLAYPSIADYWNASRSTKVVEDYQDRVKSYSKDRLDKEYEKAQAYNKELLTRKHSLEHIKPMDNYKNLLSLGGSDIMATVYIPSINVRLPVYHGTEESVLTSGLGHIDWSSLPVGGKGTHAAITGHRGLVSARLFTDIDQLEIGDIFKIYVLDRELDYKVDQITVVEPQDTKDLLINPKKDYVTLITCTPYGINTHRLLVRGERIESLEDLSYLSSEAVRIKPITVAAIMIIPASIIYALVSLKLNKR
ncbi:MAG: class C sortase [Peptoniphilaceae bacterium]|nr:class C sortase [Peptoniphilaceae bacterium]MDY6018520.1 class C sortase [Anaerococcus sp.]